MKRIKLVDIVDKEASPNRESAALDIKTDKPEITEKQDERENMRKSNSAFLPNHGSVLQGGLKYSRRLSFRNHKKKLSENIEKPYLFSSFDLESISGGFWDTWEALWTPRGALGSTWEALGTPWEVFGDALEDLLGRPWKRPPLGAPNMEIGRGSCEAP